MYKGEILKPVKPYREMKIMSPTNYTEKYNQESSAIVADNAARQRLSALFDNGEFTELDRFAKNGDKPCEAVTAYGTVNGVTVYAFSQDSTVCAGAMGAAQANKLERLYALAEKDGCPVVGIFDSAGGYIDDGVATLTAYGKLIGYATRLSGVVPQISVVAGACTGAALLLAQMADVTVALKDNEDVKAAVVADDDISAVKAAALLLSYFPQNNLAEPLWSQHQPSGVVCEDKNSAVESIADAGSVLKLFDDECECAAVYLARIGGLPAGIVSAVADDDICEAGALKIAKLVSVCDAFSLPVVTLLDAKGFSSAKAAAILAQAYSQATSPKVTVICGNAIGQAFIAMASYGANADAVFAWNNAVITAVKPCTAVQLLCQDKLNEGADRKALEEEYAANSGSPFNAAALGCIDNIIEPKDTAVCVHKAIDALAGKRVSTLDKKHSNMPF